MEYPKIILKPGKERSLQNFHPWLFSGAIQDVKGNPAEGDIVEIYSSKNNYLAAGHCHDGSISVRVFSFIQQEINYDFWKEKIAKAYTRRKILGFINNPKTNVYRLVHAEGDDMPGLIIDIYNHTAVIQTHTVGMYEIRHDLAKAIIEVYGNSIKAVYDKSAETMGKQINEPLANSYLIGERIEENISENGIRFKVDWEAGQKTGFFIDQRDNRALLSHYSKGKKVLNAFAYSGGFSVYALAGGAAMVHSVDSSQKAMEWAETNIQSNFPNTEKHATFSEDVFDYLKKMETDYEVIILDPPAFAKHLSSVDKATIGYRNLNSEALKKMKNGGILFTFSCSQVIDRTLFRKILFMSALQAGKKVRVLHQLSQPADHPINIYHPEGEYLKGLVLLVED
jgi:23S rRNA (cytosine1962-C5)-methyltransferase